MTLSLPIKLAENQINQYKEGDHFNQNFILSLGLPLNTNQGSNKPVIEDSFQISKLGGFPILPSPQISFPNDKLICHYCGNNLYFLGQFCTPSLYDSVQRIVYEFACNRYECSQKDDSLKIFILFFLDKEAHLNPKLDSSQESNSTLNQSKTHTQEHISPLLNDVKNIFDSSPNSMDQMTRLLDELNLLTIEKKVKSHTVEDNLNVKESIHVENNASFYILKDYDKIFPKVIEIDFEDMEDHFSEEPEVEKYFNVKKSHNPSNSLKMAFISDDEEERESYSQHHSHRARCKKSMNHSPLEYLDGNFDLSLEKYESVYPKHYDKYFYKYEKELSKFPWQCFRYQWYGKPLIPKNEAQLSFHSTIPICSMCGSKKVFEFQLMPAILSLLPIENDLYISKLKILQNSSQKDHTNDKSFPEIKGMDWTTVLIYSCPNDCGAEYLHSLNESSSPSQSIKNHLSKSTVHEKSNLFATSSENFLIQESYSIIIRDI